MGVEHFYSVPGLSYGALSSKLEAIRSVCNDVVTLETEACYNVEVLSPLTESEERKLHFILSSPFKPEALTRSTHLQDLSSSTLIEVGPRLNFSTPFSTNAVAICGKIGLHKIVRLELSIRYLIKWSNRVPEDTIRKKIVDALHDRMTECEYQRPISSFNHGIVPDKWGIVDVMRQGRAALEGVNDRLGLALDDWDLNYYTKLFVDKLQRNPTTVECFDLAQSNSEHSRHWFFRGLMKINGEEKSLSLIDMIISTQNHSNPNNTIKFSDNSSAIKGYTVDVMQPEKVDEPSGFLKCSKSLDIVFTAETHNFPTGVAPFSGATTGTGGRIRDVQAVGRGGLCIAGTAGYSVGNLHIPGYQQPWEDPTLKYPENFAPPLNVIIEASNGASDYGNKFGEPLINGFTRSFGQVNDGQRREWVKPIMFSGGIGCMDATMINKEIPKKGMKIIKVGGPVYRIGVGGGAASSVQVQGDNQAELDFGAVQRGDAEMENKMNRVIRACIENRSGNPLKSIHDQGAGGNGNVLKEIAEPEGAVIFTNAFSLGDESINTLELWGAEYQESNAALVDEADRNFFNKVEKRERCKVDFVGTITGNGKVILTEEDWMDDKDYLNNSPSVEKIMHPFNLELDVVLGKMPRKVFDMQDEPLLLKELSLSLNLKVYDALERVLRLLSVCSKRFLTNKVDRCVTGLIAQQQCVGPLHTPLSDYAITALTMFDTVGAATSIGEQPIKGLISAGAGARMSVAEAITNLMFAKISSLQDVKCSGNWMWAAKLPGEGAALYRACEAMCQVMGELGVAVDGGKDSLSMAARVDGNTVKAPGTIVISTYAPCPDIRQKVTPDLKGPACGEKGIILWITTSDELRLGGTALAQCYSQIGNEVPDLDYPSKLRVGFEITQHLIAGNLIKAGHDISDGGLVTCLLEMAFGGLSGLDIDLPKSSDPISTLFAEEVGWVLEVAESHLNEVVSAYNAGSIKCLRIGQSVGYGVDSLVKIRCGSTNLIEDKLSHFFQLWEETSFKLEERQSEKQCAAQEFASLTKRKGPTYKYLDHVEVILPTSLPDMKPKVAVLREEGSNGDREMAASLLMAGFDVWDVTTQDLIDGSITMDEFRGVIFPGGFSYADVLGSAKGWAACLLFNQELKQQFDSFFKRSDTFSLGVCNGCQLMALLGWIGTIPNVNDTRNGVLLEKNVSERFECRFSTVRFEKTPAVMCKGMEGCILPVWVAHGEGRFVYRSEETKAYLNAKGNIAFRYVDDEGLPTESYPMNPNGSEGGVAGICSDDGRHLAFMPHPERCSLMWQWPYVTPTLGQQIKSIHSPWMQFFTNAFNWVCNNS
uniref:Phosphoribosylformylglycinamidine synthase n=2 Tax=Lygus hesperus TaxID=30085 RepID=A0A0A9YYE3_LYGHE